MPNSMKIRSVDAELFDADGHTDRYHHYKHQVLHPLIRSVSRVTTALANVSSVFQLFFFLVVCSDMISKGFFFSNFLTSSLVIPRQCNFNPLNPELNPICYLLAELTDVMSDVVVQSLWILSIGVDNKLWGQYQPLIPLKSYHYRPQGRRTIGRPKKRWREQL